MDIGFISTSNAGKDISFILGDNPPVFTGLNKLVQLVLIVMMTDSGSDKFDDYGSGLLQLLGASGNPGNIADLKSSVTIIVTDTEQQILAEQESIELPVNERLLRIDLLDVRFSKDLELEIDITIFNEDGDKAFVRL
jgi:transcriptional regulator with AAA-type ATPase domain